MSVHGPSAQPAPPHPRLPGAVLSALLLVAALSAPGCGSTSGPPAGPAVAPRIGSDGPPEVPVVLVPGMTGSKLRDRRTGETVWGNGVHLFLPRDGAYGSVLPLAGEPRLEAFAVLDELRLGPVRKGIYGPLLEYLEDHGYRQGGALSGSAAPPDPAAALFTYPYDWRGSAVAAAAGLAQALEALRLARGVERLSVDLVCQSSGGYVCRWLAKYGGASLDEAEGRRSVDGPGGPAGEGHPHVDVRKVVLVGSANGGALRSFKEIHLGRRYVAGFGRLGLPEALFTFRSLFEDMPHDPSGLYLDSAGRPVEDADPYDAAAWERYGWSVFGPEVAERLDEGGREDLFGTPRQRREYLERQLARAERFQRLLAADPPGFRARVAGGDSHGERGPRYYLVGNGYADTPWRAVLLREGGRWRTLFPGDRELRKRPYLLALATAPGDGHATAMSMLHLSPAEAGAVGAEPFFIPGGHFEMILEPVTHRRILGFLRE